MLESNASLVSLQEEAMGNVETPTGMPRGIARRTFIKGDRRWLGGIFRVLSVSGGDPGHGADITPRGSGAIDQSNGQRPQAAG